MGARYMCGTLDIGDTRFNDVPFVPSQDCVHWEFCQEDAYKQGRKDQGELNADTVREIRELVYQQGIEKGRAEAIDECIEILAKIMPAEPLLNKGKHYENWKMRTTELRMLRDILEHLKEQNK